MFELVICTKINIKKAILEYDWRTVARYREQWRKVVHKAAGSCSLPESGAHGRERKIERGRERERGEKERESEKKKDREG